MGARLAFNVCNALLYVAAGSPESEQDCDAWGSGAGDDDASDSAESATSAPSSRAASRASTVSSKGSRGGRGGSKASPVSSKDSAASRAASIGPTSPSSASTSSACSEGPAAGSRFALLDASAAQVGGWGCWLTKPLAPPQAGRAGPSRLPALVLGGLLAAAGGQQGAV